MEILETEGEQGLTMPRLAKRADAAVGALYRYFSGKSALVASLQQRAAAAYLTAIHGQLARIDATSLESSQELSLFRLRVLFMSWHRFAMEAPHLFRLLDVSLSDPAPNLTDEDAAAVESSLGPLFQLALKLHEEAVAVGALTPGSSRLRVRALWAAFHGVEHFCKRDRLTPSHLQSHYVRAMLLRSLLLGWGASHEDLTTVMTLDLPTSPEAS